MSWSLDEGTREVGKNGVKEAREAMKRSRLGLPPEYDEPETRVDDAETEDRWANRADLR